jgi:hypothetical protein
MFMKSGDSPSQNHAFRMLNSLNARSAPRDAGWHDPKALSFWSRVGLPLAGVF